MDEDDNFQCAKFEDCSECKNKFDFLICEDCGMGEEFEPEDIDEVDAYFSGRI